MINDLDDTIKQLLVKQGKLDPAEVDISFDMPNREWSASVSKPTINFYLYDIRENHELRGTEWTTEDDGNGFATRRKNPNRFDLSYLITVWTHDAADEHRLLWHVLHTLFRAPLLTEEMLSGKLKELHYLVRTQVAQPDGLFANPSDFWAALDNELKPSLNYVVTLPLDLDIAFTAPVTRTMVMGVKQPEGGSDSFIQVVGSVLRAGKPSTEKGLVVVAREAGMTSAVDSRGNFTFTRLPEGKQTFEVLAGGKKVKEVRLNIPAKRYDIEIKDQA